MPCKLVVAPVSAVRRVSASMLRHGLRAGAGRLARQLSTSRAAGADEAAASTSAATKAFLEKFTQRAPSTMAPPNFPTDYRARPTRRGGPGGALAGSPKKPA